MHLNQLAFRSIFHEGRKALFEKLNFLLFVPLAFSLDANPLLLLYRNQET